MESRKNNTPSQIFETPEASGFARVEEEKIDIAIANLIFAGLSLSQMDKIPKWLLTHIEKNKTEFKAFVTTYGNQAIKATHQKYQDYADEHELDDVRVAVEVLRKQHD